MSEWEPATDAEVAMRDALRTDDQESYFRILAGVDLLLPVSADALAGLAPLGWGTWSTGGRTHVLAFTSQQALRSCLNDYTGASRRVPYAELANTWPNLEWWLAVNPGLPVEGYLPAWFVAQLARGDLRLPTRGPGRETHSASKIQGIGAAALAASRDTPGGPTYDPVSSGAPSPVPAGMGQASMPVAPSVAPIAPVGTPSSPMSAPPAPGGLAPGGLQPPGGAGGLQPPGGPGGLQPPVGPGGLPVRMPGGAAPSGLPTRTPAPSETPAAYQPPSVPSVPRSFGDVPAGPAPTSGGPVPGRPGAAFTGGDQRAPMTDPKGALPVRTPMANTPPVPEHVAPYDPDETPFAPNWSAPGGAVPGGGALPSRGAPAGGGALPSRGAPGGGAPAPSESRGALPRRQPGQSASGGQFSSMAGFVPVKSAGADAPSSPTSSPGFGGGSSGAPAFPQGPASPHAAPGGPGGGGMAPGGMASPGSGGSAPGGPGSPLPRRQVTPPSERPTSMAAAAQALGANRQPPTDTSAQGRPPAPNDRFGPSGPAPSIQPQASEPAVRPTLAPPVIPGAERGAPAPGYPAPSSGPGYAGYGAASSDFGQAGPGRPVSATPASGGPAFGAGSSMPVSGPGSAPGPVSGPSFTSGPVSGSSVGSGPVSGSSFGSGAGYAPSGAPASGSGFGAPGSPAPASGGAPAYGAPAYGAPAEGSPAVPPAYGSPAAVPPGYGSPDTAPAAYGSPAAVPPGYGSSAAPPADYGSSAAPPADYGSSAAVPPGYGSPAAAPAAYEAPAAYGSPAAYSPGAAAAGVHPAAYNPPAPPIPGMPPQGSPAAAYTAQPPGSNAFATQVLPLASGGYGTEAVSSGLGVAGSATGSQPPAGTPAQRAQAAADFVPANDVERDLREAADAGNTDMFLSTLLLANVLVPVASHSRPGSSPGESGFAFLPEDVEGERYLIVFTSKDRLSEHFGEPTRTVGVRFYELIRNWPDPAWSFAVNPGTPVGAKYPGAQIIALANWATEAGLGAEPAEAPIADDLTAPVPAPQPASDEAQQATVMQKTVSAEQVDYYLDRGYDRIAGFVHRASEVEHLRTPSELFDALGLTYDSSPFQPDAKEAFVLRWPAFRPSLYRIPYGGQNEQALRAMDGWVIERPPFRGNGFAPGESSDVIAEFKVDSVRLPHGAQLWRLDADGNERMLAIFDADGPLWRRVGEH